MNITFGFDNLVTFNEQGIQVFDKKTQDFIFFDLKEIEIVSCRSEEMTIVQKDNTVRIWKIDSLGQLVPSEKLKMSVKIKSISSGLDHVIILADNGSCYGWGSNKKGQLGLVISGIVKKPELLWFEHAKYITCGDEFTFVLTTDNKCFCAGDNFWGQLGLGDTETRSIPTELVGFNFTSISCGRWHVVALTQSEIFVWGCNELGQLGLGDKINRLIPTKFDSVENVISVSCGNHHTMALTCNGKVFSWGCNSNGQLGYKEWFDKPQQVMITEPIKSIACGFLSSALATENKVYVFGQIVDSKQKIFDY